MGQTTEINREDILECALEIGRCMVQSGAEVRRVEDTISRIMKAYGAKSSEVFSITALVLTTVKWENGTKSTQAKRINGFGTNLRKLECYNALARYICRNRPGVEEIQKRLEEIARSRKRTWLDILCYMISAGALTVFFGGNLLDGLAAGILGLFVFFFDQLLKTATANKLVYTLFACMVTGWLAILFVSLGLGDHLDKIMMGDIMLFIPTLALCNSLKDMLHGDILTGVYRSIEAILIAAAIAGGFFIANVTLGGGYVNVVEQGPNTVHLAVQTITAIIGSVGFSVFFHIERDKIWTAAVGGAIAWLVLLLASNIVENLFLANAIAAIAVCFYSEMAARILKAPANIFLIPAVIALLPGKDFYQAVAALVNGDIQQFYLEGEATFTTLLGIEVGFLIAFIMFTKTYGFFREGVERYKYLKWMHKSTK
ncbi:Inner membrane protein YjjP [uncultured Roseburia sp.]|uniref:Threonine/serine exporter family protein n=1 Tax=Brotonthovivens ammoniilytica TaxID=2981725 RepID=A0ABT2TLN2_9FIRM|nr:threonine/serine exporter family protein [Brotonthovivens ammoniilytica]MCU6763119.1 threonine/serine exporter family protein [Brotonthovivens ammoniilytica]SCJ03814.1 Inner membrane protein YjjP [uncultured Roseburia sp.]